MKHGFIRIGAATPKVKVADVLYNSKQMEELIDEAHKSKVRVLTFPELCVTSYTCGDLFLQEALLMEAKNQVIEIAHYTKHKNMVVAIGFPMTENGKLYNCAAILYDGKILGIVPKMNIPNYSEFYEARHFAKGKEEVRMITFGKETVPFGSNILFECGNISGFILGIEICEDLWVPMPPSIRHALAGATMILNLSASDETTGKDVYRKELVSSQSARIVSGYIYADAGEGESTTDLVYSGHNIIAENGTTLRESERFTHGLIYTEFDVKKIISERRRMSTFVEQSVSDYTRVMFNFDGEQENTELTRFINRSPFIPNSKEDKEKRCSEIIQLQAMGLRKRLQHTGLKNVVIGISGGLDSTLALLVAIETYRIMKIDYQNIIAVTMPCFGTTDRTYQNALTLMTRLGVTIKEISISEAVLLHLRDIGHDVTVHDVTYENAQARERTQILMNVANQYNGIVIGTGDMSELALGWATYNGDHMSMYGVNASVPKTLVIHLVKHIAETTSDRTIQQVLEDILDTPVSPELLPPKEGVISQKTEDLVGPYELHDFFLYYVLRFGCEPSKIYRLACYAFEGMYEKETIYQWLTIFYRRFFSQQFKRSCLPDGPKVGSVALSPRGDLRMPSDACATAWLKELESVKP